ncbi:MAG: hypothetical protein QW077_07140 [Candidatus Caldarchaeum sp.]
MGAGGGGGGVSSGRLKKAIAEKIGPKRPTINNGIKAKRNVGPRRSGKDPPARIDGINATIAAKTTAARIIVTILIQPALLNHLDMYMLDALKCEASSSMKVANPITAAAIETTKNTPSKGNNERKTDGSKLPEPREKATGNNTEKNEAKTAMAKMNETNIRMPVALKSVCLVFPPI